MFDKVATALSAVALGAAMFAIYKIETKAQPAPATSVEQLMASDSKALDAAIGKYLSDNPQTVVASLEKFQRDQRAAQQEAQAQADVALVSDNAEEIFEDGYSFVTGNPEGDVTVVEFSDYNCGYCKRAHTEVKKFIEADGNIRLVVKEFPILGAGSTLAGRAALASAMQDDGKKYEEFSDALMTHRGSHNESTVLQIAEKIGLDVEQLQVDMESPEIDAMVKRTFMLADKLSINGTPAFIIGNQVVRGFVPAAELARLTEAARSS